MIELEQPIKQKKDSAYLILGKQIRKPTQPVWRDSLQTDRGKIFRIENWDLAGASAHVTKANKVYQLNITDPHHTTTTDNCTNALPCATPYKKCLFFCRNRILRWGDPPHSFRCVTATNHYHKVTIICCFLIKCPFLWQSEQSQHSSFYSVAVSAEQAAKTSQCNISASRFGTHRDPCVIVVNSC